MLSMRDGGAESCSVGLAQFWEIIRKDDVKERNEREGKKSQNSPSFVKNRKQKVGHPENQKTIKSTA
ncbi:MAG: hypothetical protein ACRD5M_07670 [Candidatus Acidiferrales bacterium]